MTEHGHEIQSSHMTEWLAGVLLINPLSWLHWLAVQLSLNSIEAALAHVAAIIGPLGQIFGFILIAITLFRKMRPWFRWLARALDGDDEEGR